jgi:hypothetical protein
LGGRPLNVPGPPAGYCPKGPSLRVLRPPPWSARPEMTPGSLLPRTQHLWKVPTDASAFLPAPTWRPAPAKPGTRWPDRLPTPTPTPPPCTHPTERRCRGSARQVRARLRPGCAHAPSPRAACPPASRSARSGPDPRHPRAICPLPPTGQLSTPAPRLTCTGVAAAPEFRSPNPPPRNAIRGWAASGLCTPVARSLACRPVARGEQPAPTGPSCSRPVRSCCPGRCLAGANASDLPPRASGLPSMPSPRPSRPGFTRDESPLLRVFAAAGGRAGLAGRGP